VEPPNPLPAETTAATRRFPPTQSCGGLVAAVGILFVAGVGVVSTLPGSPVASAYPSWFAWALRLAPLPVLVLLWAVVSEADFKVKTDAAAICFRHGLGGVTRVPWRELHDYFADCGRNLREVAQTGGSMRAGSREAEVGGGEDVAAEAAPTTSSVAAEAAPTTSSVAAEAAPTTSSVAAEAAPTVTARALAPFAEYRPDYVLLAEGGTFVLDDAIARLGLLTEEVARHAPALAPLRWEEASWTGCEGCGKRMAVSLWPRTGGPGEWGLEPFRCPACGRVPEWFLEGQCDGFVLELRGRDRRRFVWPASPPATEAAPPEPDPTPEEEARDEAG